MRRALLKGLVLGMAGQPGLGSATRPEADRFAAVNPHTQLEFPRDHGAHPAYRIEWWYLTAWAQALSADQQRTDLGLQLTFFRVNTGYQRQHTGRFAARELLFAHAALAIPRQPKLLTAERAARSGLSLAEAGERDTRLTLGNWRLERGADDRYSAQISDSKFKLSLSLEAKHPPLLQGDRGFSRKGPSPAQASFYYSRPWLSLSGALSLAQPVTSAAGQRSWSSAQLTGHAWFDHEWSSELLDDRATGWDWVGLHLHDGSALMTFRIRSRDSSNLWVDANWVDSGQRRLLTPAEASGVQFEPIRWWRSPRTGANWPVAMQIKIASRTFDLQPLIDDQELDTQSSTGVTYWEGAVSVYERGQPIGRGYLELTGYAQALKI
jgi:predicted secreted hydrolase